MGRRKDESDFWPNVAMGDPSECWLWCGSVRDKTRAANRRYGIFHHGNGKDTPAHKYAYQKVHRVSILPGYVVRHTCNTPLCCNTNHMQLGTVADNNRDRDEQGRHRPLYGYEHGMHRWSDLAKLAIYNEYKNMKRGSVRELAAKWETTPAAIYQLVSQYRKAVSS